MRSSCVSPWVAPRSSPPSWSSFPATRLLGALGAVALMSGAIFFHLVSPLGVDPYNDGGGLFTEACETLAAALFIVFALRADLPVLAARVPFIGVTLSERLRRTRPPRFDAALPGTLAGDAAKHRAGPSWLGRPAMRGSTSSAAGCSCPSSQATPRDRLPAPG